MLRIVGESSVSDARQPFTKHYVTCPLTSQDFKLEVDDNALKLAGDMEDLTRKVIQGGGGGGKGGKSFFQSRFGNSVGNRSKSKYGKCLQIWVPYMSSETCHTTQRLCHKLAAEHTAGHVKTLVGGDEPDMLMDTTELKTMDVRKRIKLRFKDWGKIIKKDWQRIGTVGMLSLQVGSGIPPLLIVAFDAL